MNAKRLNILLLACGALLGAPRAEAAVQKFPGKGAWANVTVSRDEDWVRVKSAAGETLAQVTALGGNGHYGAVLVVSNTVDALHVDPRPAFAAGASHINIYLKDLDPAPLSGNRSVVAKIAWEGAQNMKMRDLLFARRPDGSEWHDEKRFEAGWRRKRVSEAVFNVPEATRVFHRIDIMSPGDEKDATGLFKLYGVETGDWADIGSRRPVRKNKPKLVFSASFDDGFAAERAGGDAAPVKTNGVELVEGRRGRGVRFSREARSDLAWRVKGNLNPARGTVAFWLKRENPESGDWRTLFFCPGAQKRGGGTLNFWCLGKAIRLDRHDLDRHEQYVYPNWKALGDGWHYYAVTWDGERTILYIDGRPTPQHMDEKHNDDWSPMRAALKAARLLEFARDMKAFKFFHLGSQAGDWPQDGVFDDLKIWSEALTAEEVRRLAIREGADPDPERIAANKGPNRYEAPAGKIPGRLTNLKLVRRIRPAVDPLDASQFASVGQLATNHLDGVAYLETGKRPNDRFAVRMAVDVSKPFYVIEVDYPDDTYRGMEFIVQRTHDTYGDYTLETGVFCGDEYRPSGKMRTEQYVYWTSSPDIAFIATAISGNAPAAVAEIRLYESLDGRLPAAVPETPAAPGATPRRSFANYWEDPAILYDFGTNFRVPSTFGDMVDRYAAYMKYCGQDILAFPACFYGGRIGENGLWTRDLPAGYLEAFMARFDDEGLSVVPTINQQIVPVSDGLVTRKTMSDGSLHPTSISIHSTGLPNWGGWHGTPPNFNVAHPDVQKEFLRIVKNLAEEGKSHPSFKGVALHLPTLNPMWFGSIESGYNDYCIDAFGKATGIKVPCDRKDPLRGKAYAEWLKANAYDAWVAWRCDVVADFYAKLAKTLSDARPDLRLWLNPIPVWNAAPENLADPGYTRKILLEAGFDAEKIAAKVPNAVIGLTGLPAWWRHESQYSARLRNLPDGERAKVRDWSVSAERFAQLRDLPAPWAHFHDIYHETAVGGVRTGKDVLSNDWLDETRWRVSTQHPAGAWALAPYAAALAGADAQALSCGGFLIGTLGMEAPLARWMREYRKLPAVKFSDLPSPEGWVFRTADCDGRRWTYKLKTGYPYTLQVTSEPLAGAGKKD